MIGGDDLDIVAGPELGAVSLVTGVTLKTGIDSVYVRSGKKHSGTQARIEGTRTEGTVSGGRGGRHDDWEYDTGHCAPRRRGRRNRRLHRRGGQKRGRGTADRRDQL